MTFEIVFDFNVKFNVNIELMIENIGIDIMYVNIKLFSDISKEKF